MFPTTKQTLMTTEDTMQKICWCPWNALHLKTSSRWNEIFLTAAKTDLSGS